MTAVEEGSICCVPLLRRLPGQATWPVCCGRRQMQLKASLRRQLGGPQLGMEGWGRWRRAADDVHQARPWAANDGCHSEGEEWSIATMGHCWKRGSPPPELEPGGGDSLAALEKTRPGPMAPRMAPFSHPPSARRAPGRELCWMRPLAAAGDSDAKHGARCQRLCRHLGRPTGLPATINHPLLTGCIDRWAAGFGQHSRAGAGEGSIVLKCTLPGRMRRNEGIAGPCCGQEPRAGEGGTRDGQRGSARR